METCKGGVIIVYDIEIKRPPIQKSPALVQYEYANGWEDYEGMGIAVVPIYDYFNDNFDVYDENKESLAKLQYRLNTASLVSGFNIKKFDNAILRAFNLEILDNKCYDILEQLWFAHGLTGIYDPKTHGGFNLDAVLKVNFNSEFQKTMNGEQAPYMWQDGKKQEVINYCINDVKVEKALLDRIFEKGGLISPKTKKFIKMPIPMLF